MIGPISQEFSDFNLNFDKNGDIFPGYDIEKINRLKEIENRAEKNLYRNPESVPREACGV